MGCMESISRDYKSFSIYIASGADRHLDIAFGLQLVESSSLVSVLFREAFIRSGSHQGIITQSGSAVALSM